MSNISKIKKIARDKFQRSGNAIIHINSERIPEMVEYFPDGSNIDWKQVEGEFPFMAGLWDKYDVDQDFFVDISVDYSTGEVLFNSIINLKDLKEE